ncbi:MAG: hypothetical protein O9327_02895 [Polaromonas sp.]|nr:hypothetical protein [Polaromonas sp.]
MGGLQGLFNVVGCRSSLRQVIKDRWRGRLSGLPLNRKTANADGGPAADGFEKNLKQLVAEYERVEGRWQAKAGWQPTTHF